jgi:flagellar assembly factor FliW
MTTLTLKLEGTRFGALDYCESDVIAFVGGLIGFPTLGSFVVISHRENSPFRWLQSLDEPSLAFLTVDPSAYVQGYEPEISDDDAQALQLDTPKPTLILVTVSIPGGNVGAMTINLAAPIVINLQDRLARQVVLDGDFSIHHPAFARPLAA